MHAGLHVNDCTLSLATKERTYLFPLWLFPDSEASASIDHSAARPNLSAKFLARLAVALGLPQQGVHGLPRGLKPEDIFDYAYAVLHSPGYRSRYAEFLKSDFPRLPLIGDIGLFRSLTRLGNELVALHLLESDKVARRGSKFLGRGRGISKVTWSANNAGTVWIDGNSAANDRGTSGFSGVPEAVWNFRVGGYQVCEKWLKDRKGRTLSDDDITHYNKIVIVLTETMRLMKEIDEVIERHGGWPAAFETDAEPTLEEQPSLLEVAEPWAK